MSVGQWTHTIILEIHIIKPKKRNITHIQTNFLSLFLIPHNKDHIAIPKDTAA